MTTTVHLPLEDPAQDKELRELLELELTPLDIQVQLSFEGETVLEIVYPKPGYFVTHGATSTMGPGEVMIRRSYTSGESFLSDIDPAAFNLGHLSPLRLPAFTREVPLVMCVEPTPTMVHPPAFRMTLWGRLLKDPTWADDSVGTWRLSEAIDRVPKEMLEALRLLKRHDIEFEDDSLRALMDKCAPLL
ncbi:MAG: hypothetical protein K0U16_07515 [Gammaproteobacteria bacterium]|nr:hypothetical protein [Gammaproteobacteria bacterium]